MHLGCELKCVSDIYIDRVVLTTTEEWGTKVTKLTVPADWKGSNFYLECITTFFLCLRSVTTYNHVFCFCRLADLYTAADFAFGFCSSLLYILCVF